MSRIARDTTAANSRASGCESTFGLFDCSVDPAWRDGDFSRNVVNRLVGVGDIDSVDSCPVVWP